MLSLVLPKGSLEKATLELFDAADLGVRSVRLLTNNPAKVSGLAACGVDITARVALASAVTPYNLRYLVTKRDRLGHQIQDLGALAPAAESA